VTTPLLNIFEPLFLLLALVTVITLISTAVFSVSGKFARAGRTLRRLGIGDAPNLGLVYTHEGGFPIGWLIITEGGWFQKPPIVRLTTP
jgi:hypothetical protein